MFFMDFESGGNTGFHRLPSQNQLCSFWRNNLQFGYRKN